uniref:methionyl-tRNA formyltransferase n=1 Tax=Arcella intermedia TaxID=1963864 RepID=A0A6B2L8B3_9EUKA
MGGGKKGQAKNLLCCFQKRFTNSKGYKVLFFGSDNVSLPTLKALKEASKTDLVSKLEVVTSKSQDTPKGTKVFEWCQSSMVPVHFWPLSFPSEGPNSFDFDIGVVVSFGYFIPKELIYKFPKQMINMHPSLLPKYRGANPIGYTLLNNDPKGGVSIITLHPTEFDKGKILLSEEIDIPTTTTYPELEKQLAQLGASKVIQLLQNFDEYSAKAVEQEAVDGKLYPYSKKFTTSHGNVQWPALTAMEAYGRWRSMPSKTYTFLNTRFIKLVKLQYPDPAHIPPHITSKAGPPGSISFDKETDLLYVKCKEGWIGVESLQLAGKPVYSARIFSNGFQLRREGHGEIFNEVGEVPK